jgi:hypothetical protein
VKASLMANDFDEIDLKAKLEHIPQGPMRSSDRPTNFEVKGKSQRSTIEEPVVSIHVWAFCEDGQKLTDDIDVRLPNTPDDFDALSGVAGADTKWERLWRENIDKVDRAIKNAQKRLQEKCAPLQPDSDFKCVLKWHDLEKQIRMDEPATYYNVQFTLTSLAPHRELGTWTEWVRIPGDRSHYGCSGSTMFDASSGLASAELIAHARTASGLEFRSAPSV